MNRIAAELLCGFVAFAAAIVSAYACWHKFHPDKLRAKHGEDTIDHRRLSSLASNLPVLAGYLCGYMTLVLFSRTILPGDRFYSARDAMLIALVPLCAGILYVATDLIVPPALARKPRSFRRHYTASSQWRVPTLLVASLITAVSAAALGIRFPIMSVGGARVMELGQHALIASMVWLVLATFIVKLLDGLDGAASMLLLVCAGVVYYTTSSTAEYFLNTLSIITIGVVLGSFRFYLHPARTPLRGGGSLFVGFLFAVLTVLARQKSVTAGLIVVPILLFALLLGGAMLGFLERNLLLRKDDDS